MTYVAVIDTNVIVSALLKEDSNPGKILSFIQNDVIIPVYNEEILKEYDEILNKSKFNFSKDRVENALRLFKEKGRVLSETKTDEFFNDKTDIKFFQVVLTANMIQDSYLVTGNLKHFPQRVFVINPAMMVEMIESN